MSGEPMEEFNPRQLALDVLAGRVFGSWMVPGDDLSILRSIFMPVGLGDSSMFPKDAVAVYEYLDKAGPMAINGYPMFFSCRIMTSEQADQYNAAFEEAKAQQDAFLKGAADGQG